MQSEHEYSENDAIQMIFSFNFRRVLGIITKKDVLLHIAALDEQDPLSVMFH